MDVELHIDTGREFKPHAALLIYRDAQNGDSYGEFHHAFAKDGQFHVAEAHPLTTGDLAALIESLGATALQFTPEHVVAASAVAMAWWSPAQPRTLYFQSHTDESLNALSGQRFAQPPLVFIATRRDLSVYALADNVRPSADTPLMCAPYFNLFARHGVCQGTTPYPKHVEAQRTAEWEQAFFGSNFTHNAAGARKITTFGGSHSELWRAVQAAGTFDPALLSPAGVTLKEALR